MDARVLRTLAYKHPYKVRWPEVFWKLLGRFIGGGSWEGGPDPVLVSE
jgi:hypothetical protein